MRNKINTLRISMFLVLLIVPSVLYFFVSQYLDLKNYENHELLTTDEIRKASWNEKTEMLEEYYGQNLPYKNELTRLNYWFDIEILKNIDSDTVLLGKNDWLFYKGDNCIDDYCGKLEMSQEDIDNTIDAMNRMADYCADREIQLIYFVSPNKETIYGDLYMPDYVKVIDENSRANVLINAIEDRTYLKIIYPENELCYYRDCGYQVYRKYDTHWNNIGAYIGADCILRATGYDGVKLEELNISTDGYISGDLANMIAMGNRYNDDMNYVIDNYKNDIKISVVENRVEPFLNYTHWSSNSENVQILMCIGDSFLGAMEGYLARNYKESYFLHRGNYQAGTIDSIKPDIVVISVTERAFPKLYNQINLILESEAQ